ncbi:hypothetical protein ACI3LZ_004160 [Candidozyma auris]
MKIIGDETADTSAPNDASPVSLYVKSTPGKSERRNSRKSRCDYKQPWNSPEVQLVRGITNKGGCNLRASLSQPFDNGLADDERTTPHIGLGDTNDYFKRGTAVKHSGNREMLPKEKGKG